MTVRVLIVEDHPMFREGLRLTLDRIEAVTVTAAVDSLADARIAIQNDPPDLVLLDLQLADGSGLALAAELASHAPAVRVLVLTSADDAPTIHAALRAGTHGYLHKTASPADIARAVEAIANGDGVFDAAALQRITAQFASGGRAADHSPFPQLTPREHEVLDYMARGMSNSAIADHLVISHKTVRNQVSSIFAKLRVARREEAILLARDQGMGG